MSVLEIKSDYLVHAVCTHSQKYHCVKAKSSVFQNSARTTANGELECQFVKPESYAFLQAERAFVTGDTELECHFVETKMHAF